MVTSSVTLHTERLWGWESLGYESSVAFIGTVKSIRFGVLIWHCTLQAVLTIIKRIFSLIFTIQLSQPYTYFPSRADWWKQAAVGGSAFCTNPDCTLAKPYLLQGKNCWFFFFPIPISFLWGIHPNTETSHHSTEKHQGMHDTTSEAGNISSSQNFISEQSYSVAIWTHTLNVFFFSFHQSVFVFIHSFYFLSSSRDVLNKARGILLIV